MARFVKKPIEVEAVLLAADNKSIKSCLEFIGQHVSHDRRTQDEFCTYCNIVRENGLEIHTLEGIMTASIGDWIIQGVNGEFYPCKPDIFFKTYDRIGVVNND